jgi:hypothetical protein
MTCSANVTFVIYMSVGLAVFFPGYRVHGGNISLPLLTICETSKHTMQSLFFEAMTSI